MFSFNKNNLEMLRGNKGENISMNSSIGNIESFYWKKRDKNLSHLQLKYDNNFQLESIILHNRSYYSQKSFEQKPSLPNNTY
jgi:hypothetical protein